MKKDYATLILFILIFGFIFDSGYVFAQKDNSETSTKFKVAAAQLVPVLYESGSDARKSL